jgi:hypothetical protein
MWEFARKYGFVTVFSLAAAVAACSGAGQPVSQQDLTVSSDGSEVVTGQSEAEASEGDLMVALPDLGPAPDISNEVWLNTDRPLNLEAVRGRVVLVEFWTFG